MLQAEARRTKVKEARKRREERQDTKKKEMLQVRSDNPYVSENMKYLKVISHFSFPLNPLIILFPPGGGNFWNIYRGNHKATHLGWDNFGTNLVLKWLLLKMALQRKQQVYSCWEFYR